MTSQEFFFFFFFCISAFWIMYWWSIIKNIHSPNLVGICSWEREIWPHEYIISPIEISVNWPGFKQLWTRPIYTRFNGDIIRYSCSHIWGHHEPIHVKFGVWWGFCIMFYWNMIMKMLKCKKENLMTSHFSTPYKPLYYALHCSLQNDLWLTLDIYDIITLFIFSSK